MKCDKCQAMATVQTTATFYSFVFHSAFKTVHRFCRKHADAYLDDLGTVEEIHEEPIEPPPLPKHLTQRDPQEGIEPDWQEYCREYDEWVSQQQQ